ncbi:MAG: murein transglycosylase [Phycisphaera sp.]|nr:murein transglycosylase [Phycisphaera sp.]
MSRTIRLLVLVLFAAVPLGCKREIVTAPDYSRPLPPGQYALRKILDQSQLPDLTVAFNARDQSAIEAMTRSIKWFDIPSTRQFFPFPGIEITHEQARSSVFAFRQLFATCATGPEFQQRVREEFDTYISVGWNDNGVVLFTGYYTPEFNASLQPTAEFRYPIYTRPPDLVSDPATGKVLGQRTASGVRSYPTRRELETSGALKGRELVYFRDPLESYIVQVNGSAKLTLTDGKVIYVGFAGTNGHDYTSIGKLLVKDGKLEANRVSLPAIRAYFNAHPDELSTYVNQNDRYVFFQEYDGSNWPAGSLGFAVTPMRTLATDKDVFPRGGVVLVQTTSPVSSPLGSGTPLTATFSQVMLDQDTGGAIRAPGRGDIYMGQGAAAEQLAGRQFAEGYLYYFFLKPQRVAAWQSLMRSAATGPAPSRVIGSSRD